MNPEIKIEETDGKEFAVCPHKDNEVAFSLSVVEGHKPCGHDNINPLIYLNVNERLDEALKLVTKHGVRF